MAPESRTPAPPARRLRAARRLGGRASAAGRPPGRALVRRRDRAPRGRPSAAGWLADGHRAAVHAVALDDPAVAAFARGGAEFWRTGRATIPRRSCVRSSTGRLRLRASRPPAARARAGCAGAGRRARPVGGGDPARRALPPRRSDTRGLRRAPPGVRRDLRRPRARARRRAARHPGPRPQPAARPGFTEELLAFVSQGRRAACLTEVRRRAARSDSTARTSSTITTSATASRRSANTPDMAEPRQLRRAAARRGGR